MANDLNFKLIFSCLFNSEYIYVKCQSTRSTVCACVRVYVHFEYANEAGWNGIQCIINLKQFSQDLFNVCLFVFFLVFVLCFKYLYTLYEWMIKYIKPNRPSCICKKNNIITTHDEKHTKEEIRVNRWEKTLQFDSVFGLFSSYFLYTSKVLTTIDKEVFIKQQ